MHTKIIPIALATIALCVVGAITVADIVLPASWNADIAHMEVLGCSDQGEHVRCKLRYVMADGTSQDGAVCVRAATYSLVECTYF